MAVIAAMKVVSPGIWRRLRWLLVLLCVGGGVLAAENNWLTSLKVGHASMIDWLERLTSDDTSATKLEAPAAATNYADANYSMNGWLDRALFYQPGSGWTFAAMSTSTRPIITPQQSGPVVETFTTAAPVSSGVITPVPPIYDPPAAPTASGVWALNSSGNWSNSANWAGGTIADGAGNIADFSQFDLTNNIVVNVDSARTIGDLYVGDTNGTHSYTISGSSTLTFDDNNPADFELHSILQQSSTSHGDTIAVPILLNNDLEINNLSATRQFTISGNIAASTGANSFPVLWFNNHSGGSAGDILVSGNISNGTANNLSLVVARGGTVTLTGTNTYTGFTEVDGGTLLINGNNSAATGNVYVYNTGTLGGTGTIGGDVRAFSGTVTGATTTTVGTLTMLGNANFATGEGIGGTYLANLSGALSDLLAITGTITLGLDTTLNIVGTADGVTTYTLATFASHNGVFETVMGIPSGYALVYNPTDLELVPIPEPATWIGGALALGVIGLAARRRSRRSPAA